MTTTQGMAADSGTRIRRSTHTNSLTRVVENAEAPVMKQGIIMRSPTENSPTTCIQASASEPEADAAPEAPADVDQIGDVSLPERLWRAVPASAGLPACAVGRARQTNCADCDALPRCVGRRATIRVEIAEIRNSPCEIAVFRAQNGDFTRGIAQNGYFNP